MTEDAKPILHARICTVEGCSEFIRCKGLCKLHYGRHLAGIAMNAKRNISRDGLCLVDGCDRRRYRTGLCSLHYDRTLVNATCPKCGIPKSSKSGLCLTCRTAELQAHLPTEKTCRQCGRTLPIDSFGARKGAMGGAKWRSRCRKCEALNTRASRAAGGQRRPDSYQAQAKARAAKPYQGLRTYARKLGIPWEQVVDRYPTDNRCELCGRTPQEANPGGRYVRLSLDHDHETGALRGFLCGPCNMGLGQLGDSQVRVRKALKYLQRHEKAVRATAQQDVPTLFDDVA